MACKSAQTTTLSEEEKRIHGIGKGISRCGK